MRIFLDENVDPRLATRLVGHDVASVRDRGWFGIKNGELIARIEPEFDALISHDRGLENQQNWSHRELGLVLILSPTTNIASYESKIAEILGAIESIDPGSIRIILV